MIKRWTRMRLPRLGSIALGEKRPDGSPKACNHFVVPPAVAEVYGAQPTELEIMFVSNNIEDVFPSALKRYGKAWGLICTGDGETAGVDALYAQRPDNDFGIVFNAGHFHSRDGGEILPVEQGHSGGRQFVQIPCPDEGCPHYQAGHCREMATLHFILPKVKGVLGVWTIDTSSKNSFESIVAGLHMLMQFTNGRLAWVPVTLRVDMVEAHPGVQDRRIKTEVPVLSIDISGVTPEQLALAAKSNTLPHLLPGGDSVPPIGSPVRVEIDPRDETVVPELLYAEVIQDGNPPDDPEGGGGPGGGGGRPVEGRGTEQVQPAEGARAMAMAAGSPQDHGSGPEAVGSPGDTKAERQIDEGRAAVLKLVNGLPRPYAIRALMRATTAPWEVCEDLLNATFADWLVDQASQETVDLLTRALAVQLVIRDSDGLPEKEKAEILRSFDVGVADGGVPALEDALSGLDLAQLRLLGNAIRNTLRKLRDTGAKPDRGSGDGDAASGANAKNDGAQSAAAAAENQPKKVAGRVKLLMPAKPNADGTLSAKVLVVASATMKPKAVVSVTATGSAADALRGMPPNRDFNLDGFATSDTAVTAEGVELLEAKAS